MKILGLCGSLRAASINAALLRATARLAPPQVEVRLYGQLGELPLFNPDLDGRPPPPVRTLYEAVSAADALLIASPEYAHGVSGTIKNALDWLVSFEPFVHVPVAVFNASPRAHHADAALKETLKTMSAALIERACIAVPLLGSQLDEDGMVGTPAVAVAVRGALLEVEATVALKRRQQSAAFPV